MVAFSLSVVDFSDEVLTLKFLSQKDLESFKNSNGASDILRTAILDVLGVQVKFRAQIDEASKPAVQEAPAAAASAQAAPTQVAPVRAQAPAPAAAPTSEEVPPPLDEPEPEEQFDAAPMKSRNSSMVDESARYGESLLREMLGAEPIIDKNGGK